MSHAYAYTRRFRDTCLKYGSCGIFAAQLDQHLPEDMVGCSMFGVFGVSERKVLSCLAQRLRAVTLLKQRLP